MGALSRWLDAVLNRMAYGGPSPYDRRLDEVMRKANERETKRRQDYLDNLPPWPSGWVD